MKKFNHYLNYEKISSTSKAEKISSEELQEIYNDAITEKIPFIIDSIQIEKKLPALNLKKKISIII